MATPTAAVPDRPVLVVLHGESVGGASLSVLRLIPALEERGWRFEFWAPRPSALFEELQARGHVAHGRSRPFIGYSFAALRVAPGVRRRLARVPGYFGELRQVIKRADPALVHANSLYAFAEATLASSLGYPTVLHVHEMVRPNAKGRIARTLAHRINDVVIGVSDSCARALSTPRKRARTVYECVEVPPSAPRREARAGRTVVGTIGVISERKGSDLFVEAAEIVRRRTSDVEFRLVGAADDPLDARWAEGIAARARAIGITHIPRTDVPSELAGLDVFVLPSRSDPFPIVVLEAMASALPVIGTRVDGLAEQVAPATGLLVDGDDPQALAEAILALHADPERRLRLGAAGRERVAENFALSRQVEGVHDAYLAALRRS